MSTLFCFICLTGTALIRTLAAQERNFQPSTDSADLTGAEQRRRTHGSRREISSTDRTDPKDCLIQRCIAPMISTSR